MRALNDYIGPHVIFLIFPNPVLAPSHRPLAGGSDGAVCRGGEVPRTQPHASVVCTEGDGAADLRALLPSVLPRVRRHFVWQRRRGAPSVRTTR
jgi:hypothetical protein